MSTLREPVVTHGSYDANGIIHVDPQGQETIRVEYSKIQHHTQASVFINEVNQGFVTFGMNGERAINTYVQGFGADEARLGSNIENIMSSIN